MGVERSIKEYRTGRGFLQDLAMAHSEGAIGVSHFFETLKGQRRLDLITEVNIRVQAQFLCLAHNLMLLMESELKSNQRIINHKEIRRAEQRGDQAKESAKRQSRHFSPLYLNPFRRSQLSLKFIRWLSGIIWT